MEIDLYEPGAGVTFRNWMVTFASYLDQDADHRPFAPA
jgi:hypothetical protein